MATTTIALAACTVIGLARQTTSNVLWYVLDFIPSWRTSTILQLSDLSINIITIILITLQQ